LEPHGITLGAVVQFLRIWEASKKRGVFLILACIYKYIEDFEEQNLSKALFSNAPNALNRNSNISCLLGDQEIHALPI
jgi:hypothetical protein